MKFLKACLACMLVFTLTACGQGSSEENSDKTVLTFWGHQNEAWNKAYEEMAAKFEAENEDIEIKFEFFPYDQFESKVQTSLLSQEGGADIYELWGGWGIDFAPTGALAPINDTLTKEILDGYYEPTYGSLMFEEKLYGFPLEFNIEYGGMIINDNILEEKSISVPQNWEELRAAAKNATVKDGDTFVTKGFDFVNWDSVTYMFTSMIMSQGGSYQNEDGTFTFNTEEGRKAFQELTDMVVKDGVTDLSGLTGGEGLEGYQQLFAGTTAMVPRGPWTISEGELSFELKYGEDFDYVSLPFYGETQSFAAETGWSLAVNGNSKKSDAAMRFLEFFAQEENLLEFNVACAQIPASKEVAQDPEFIKKMPYAEPLVKILDDGHFVGYFNTDTFKEKINEVFTEYAIGGYASVDDALMDLDKKLNSAINK
ncbi:MULTISPECIES: ABC transporter substrate-binding protein [unclassified Breznakia]|uniref:ABC transporter substrate-binding protein n=1 Tax=unclassified Breznakia TaxID=2623764 RepID=UPI0024771965|nr:MULTISPECIES: ABC transporter substrate-binding protein [unclassified Breznakia]MDH6367246.1 multiple sugar transport system substrate-binding protein [Breznakia sp. PH1-1]MDH6404425.1 multiple sugar transport system substrate-binding protein [Breznakia sp. PF1-11]MDH6412184.1 multiple sugar transport system substrate-binding protein [Breznakia sp. PFB1-11]MDH6414413.1 multiple sugar transport system substrate-binding protein [Breznakia sp. PFB1-14]MDH6416798.1 multiple sugar transport syst